MAPPLVSASRTSRRALDRLAYDLHEVELERDGMGHAREDLRIFREEAEPDDIAQQQWLDTFERQIVERQRWIDGLARRAECNYRQLVMTLTWEKFRTQRPVGFRTVALRPRRACSGSGRPAARRTASSRAGPDPDPDEPEPPAGGSTDVLLGVVA